MLIYISIEMLMISWIHLKIKWLGVERRRMRGSSE